MDTTNIDAGVVEVSKKKEYTCKFDNTKFELLEELPIKMYNYTDKYGKFSPAKQHMVKLKCKKCGHEKIVCDKSKLSCKEGICNIRFVDRTGIKYGNLTALKPVKTDNAIHPWQWLCRCSCGEKELVAAAILVSGKESCRKCGKEHRIEHNLLKGDAAKWHRIIRTYKKNALKRGRCFELLEEECMSLFKGDCFYCSEPPAVDSAGLIRSGIDCKNALKGYTTDNTVSCCPVCNIMKAAHSIPSFLSHILKIVNSSKDMIELLDEDIKKEGSLQYSFHRDRYVMFGEKRNK